MSDPVNSPISMFEHVVRCLYYPSQEDKKGKLKPYSTFPLIKRDSDNAEYCNNKLSLLRICKASVENAYSPIIESALTWETAKKKLRGFLEWSCRDIAWIFSDIRYRIIPDASDRNPYHLHLIVEDLKIGYTSDLEERKQKGELRYVDLYPPQVHDALVRLRDYGHRIKIDNGIIVGPSSPCHRCLTSIPEEA